MHDPRDKLTMRFGNDAGAAFLPGATAPEAVRHLRANAGCSLHGAKAMVDRQVLLLALEAATNLDEVKDVVAAMILSTTIPG